MKQVLVSFLLLLALTGLASANPLKPVTDQDFDQTLAQTKADFLLVLFTTPVCHTCKKVKKMLAENQFDQAEICTYDLDQSNKKASQLGVGFVPVLIIFQEQKESKRFFGPVSENQLRETLSQLAKGQQD